MQYFDSRSLLKNRLLKLIYCFILVLMVSPSIAQIPSGYYDPAQGLTGDDLKAALHDIIKGHTEFPYSSSSTDVWDILKDADKDPNNSNNVIGLYSNFSMDGPAEFDNNAGWNREHVWAKSRGDFGTSLGPGTDTHHIRATDVSTNSARNNRNFDNAPDQYIDASGNYSGPTDSYTSSVDWTWEPRDEVKGDVARMIFYMAVRYEGDSGEPDLELTETLLDNTDQSPIHGKMSVLLAWHLADPVSTSEQTRNDVIYGYQNNRNPFIDHPEYVCQIYTCTTAGNSSPIFTSTPITAATQDVLYTYNITATDADSDVMTISGSTIPSWLSFTDTGNGTATLTGTPSSGEIGDHNVILTLTAGSYMTTQSFKIVVASDGTGNNAPVFTSTPVTSVVENQTYTYNIVTADDDSDGMTIAGTTIPTWLSFVDNTGGSATLSGTPALADLGSHSVILTVTDGTDNTEQSFTINVSAADGSSDASDLFFSEYIEGSSFNKGLEVANFTSADVDLSIYSIQKQTNGAGDWGSELSLSGTLTKGDVFVVVNTAADDVMLAQADVTTGAGSVTFNGNDPVGLFKNGVLIDLLGTFGNTANFAQNETLVRNSNVTSPNATYTVSEWTSHSSDTFTFLGAHTFGSSNDPCDIPAGMSADNITSHSADLSWSSATGAASYNIRYKTASGASWVEATSADLSFALTGLNSETEYEFQIQSVCSAATSDFSSSTNFTTLVNNCDVATGLVASNITSSSADLSWTKPTDGVNYEVRYRATGTSNWTTATTTSESRSISGLNSDTEYEFQVQTVCSGESSDFSASSNFTTLVEVCDVATGLAAANITTSTADLSWSSATGAVSYNIQHKETSATTWVSNTSNSADISISELTPNASYEFQVKTVCSNGSSDFSASANFSTVVTSFDDETDLGVSISLFPNPTEKTIQLNVELGSPNKLNISILNMEGKLVYTIDEQITNNAFEHIIDISSLKNGLYVLKIYTDSGIRHSSNFVVQK